jgi:CubicO group peptidase (beta-lactamase class C family)
MKSHPLMSGPCDVTPAEAGFHAPVLDKLNDFLSGLVAAKKLQCAGYLLARHGRVFAHAALGGLLPGPSAPPFRPDSIRMIASTTKVFTAVALMQLAERGFTRASSSDTS